MVDTAAIVGALIVLAVALAWPVPGVMAGLTAFRRAPRPALVVWQATSVAAVLAALSAAPAAVRLVVSPTESLADHAVPVGLAAAVTGLVAARLLMSGHRVGTRLRAHRRRHRELVDLLGATDDALDHRVDHRIHSPRHTRVLEHPTPTAYCVPGLRRRVVLTQGALDALPDDELSAVLAHERAHLAARHDLVLEFFTVAHEAVPRYVRSDPALREVTLLIEVLADRAAVRETGVLTTARAITHMAGPGSGPDGTLAMGDTPSSALLRIGLLEGGRIAGLPQPAAAALMYVFAASVAALPVALLVLAWWAG